MTSWASRSMEALYKAAKGGGFLLGVRWRQLVLCTLAVVSALLFFLAWEGTPFSAVQHGQSITLPLYLHSLGYSKFSSAVGSYNAELKEPAEIVDEDDTVIGDTTAEDTRRVNSSVDEVSSDSNGVEDFVQEASSKKDYSSGDEGAIAGDRGLGHTGEEREIANNSGDEAVEAEAGKVGNDKAGAKGESATSWSVMKEVVDRLPEDTSLQDGDGSTRDTGYLTQKPGKLATCDFTSGRWVEDDSRPAYSGLACHETGWLSFMWACRKYERPDFAYEKFRWQPDKCDLPVLDGGVFLNRMKNQVLGFVGDSLGRQQFQSMMCLLTGGGGERPPEDVGPEFGFKIPKRGKKGKPTGWAYRFQETNTTVLFHWSVCLCEIEAIPNDPGKHSKMHLDRPAVFLRDYFTKLDSLVVNTGHHWNRGKIDSNKWIMHREGKPLSSKSRRFTVGDAYNFTAHAVAHWLHEQMEKTGKRRVVTKALHERRLEYWGHLR